MTTDALDTLSWDLPSNEGGPRRPSLDDLGGAQLEDDDPNPDPSEPSADPFNQMTMQASAIAKVVNAALVNVQFTAGTPAVAQVTAAGSAVDVPTFTLTDNGNGDTTVTWPAQSSPPTVPLPVANAIATAVSTSSRLITTTAVTNGVRVRTWNAAGTATDTDFSLYIF
jgi:hypothetical protein